MKRNPKVKNNLMYILLVIVIIITIVTFIVFISIFNKYDKNEYNVEKDSILYGEDYNYIKVSELATLKQRFDGNYYLYETIDGESYKHMIGTVPVIFKAGDSYLYLYGEAYQIYNTGEVAKLSGETKIPKTSPTKIFKLGDRKYLMVDSELRSLNDNIINTRGYLIIEIDKQGNATFANNELNFKAIKPVIITGTSFDFDIANEKIMYNNETIDLKNVIGSTNEFKKYQTVLDSYDGNESNEEKEQTTENTDYYDKYLSDVIKSVNNLTESVTKVGENSKTKINTGSVYYDFNKWIVLKSVSSSVSSITLNYTVFDPNNEYRAVFARIIDKAGVGTYYYVNQSDTSYTIGNLKPDSEYTISFGYQKNTSQELTVVDEITVKTLKPNYSITVDKIAQKNIEDDQETITKYYIYYTLNADINYILNSADIVYYRDDILTYREHITKDMFDSEKKYKGIIELQDNLPLGAFNKITLESVMVCDGEYENNCNSDVNLNVANNFCRE